MNQHLCKNCEHTFAGNFCSNCGQKTNTVRLNWAYLKDEANYTILHFNKGFLYTIRELFTRPGDTIREFLEGKRVKHYKPLLLVFVLAGINGYLSLQMDLNRMMQQYSNPKVNSVIMAEYTKVMHWFFAHYSMFEILALPIVSLASWLSFKKWGYNYIENIIINCFATSQRLMIGVLLFPLQYFLRNTPYFLAVSFLTVIPTFGYTIWMIVQLYKNQNTTTVFLRMLLFVFNLSLFFILLLLISIVAFVFLIKLP